FASGRGLERFATGLYTTGDFDIDFVLLLSRGGGPVLAGRAPEKAKRPEERPLRGSLALQMAGHELVREVRGGMPASAGTVGLQDAPGAPGVGTPAVLGAAEVRGPGGRRLGIVVTGVYLDHRKVKLFSKNVGSPVAIVEEGGVISQGIGNELVRRLLPPRSLGARAVTFESGLRGERFLGAVALLPSTQGPIAAPLLVISDFDVTRVNQDITMALFLVTIAVGTVALALALLFGRRIARPIQDLTLTATAVREGNLQAQANVSGGDEVGQLGETFNDMTAALHRMTGDLRKAARDEHDLRARIETVINSMADGLVAVDDEHNVLAFNPAAESLTRFSAAAALGKSVEDVVDVRDARGTRLRLPVFDLAEGAVADAFLVGRGADPRPVAITSAVLRDADGRVTGAVAVIRDMTREFEVERMKSQFLANISHELRTPLTPIKGYAELLGRLEVPSDNAERFVQGILDSTRRLERIVELLVDYAALEGGRLSPRSGSVDLGSMVEELAGELKRRAPQYEVTAQITRGLPRVSGDARLLRRSLEEILDNAVKFSPQGGRIRLEARGPDGNGRRRRFVEVVISDEGIGIAPEHLDQIFSDFHQVDGSETRTYGGLGLGLAFVQRIVEAHDGRVGVESRPDRGTTLTITIPVSTEPR
ncbi:MAG: sensor histidine kinase, partial [Actinomycetota bacterium]